MRLPFVLVPRAVWDQQLRAIDDERRRVAKLTRVIVRMKVAGGSIPRSPYAKGAPIVDRPPDRAQQIIDGNKHAQARPAIKKALEDFLMTARRNHMADAEIEKRLADWTSIARNRRDDDDADDDLIEVQVD